MATPPGLVLAYAPQPFAALCLCMDGGACAAVCYIIFVNLSECTSRPVRLSNKFEGGGRQVL